MPEVAGKTIHFLDRLRAGDEQARNKLLEHSCKRLHGLTRNMIRGFPAVRRWEQTEDVLQNALIRLHRVLAVVKPESTRHFYHLAAQQIRRELIDLARHHMGPRGHGAKHYSDHDGKAPDDQDGPLQTLADLEVNEPETLLDWTTFHQQVEALPEEERELFGLLWYQGFTQEQAADVLGVSFRTVKRRWQSARMLLAQALTGEAHLSTVE